MPVALIVNLAIKALNNPATKALAKRIMKNVGQGNVARAQEQASILKPLFNKGIARLKGATIQTKPLTKNVNLRRELYYNPHTQTAGRGYFGDLKKTPMIDIDIKGKSHYARNVYHKGKPEALGNLFNYLKTPQGKKSLFATYETPGGIRLFDLSRRKVPKKYYNPSNESGWLNLKLGGDPDYPVFNMKRGGYGTRLSPKPGREGDYVAKFLDYYGSGQAIPKNVLEVKKYHDALIKRVLNSSSKENINIGGLFDLIGR
jgi:hypothetical protein